MNEHGESTEGAFYLWKQDEIEKVLVRSQAPPTLLLPFDCPPQSMRTSDSGTRGGLLRFRHSPQGAERAKVFCDHYFVKAEGNAILSKMSDPHGAPLRSISALGEPYRPSVSRPAAP